MECHSDEELTKSINDSTEMSLYVNIDAYNKSVHQDFECIDCHSTIESAEHEEDLPDVDCGQCHEEIQQVYNESIHSNAIIQSEINIAHCKDCHGNHNILPSDEKNSMTNKLNISHTCGSCHSKPEVIKLLGLRGEGPVVNYHKSIHNKLLHEEKNLNAPTCTDCHGSHSIFLMSDPRSTFNKLNIPETCGKCHSKETGKYTESIHWKSVKRGHFESPVCNDCHGEHKIESPRTRESITNYLNIASQVCARCHSSETLMERFGLNSQQFTSYMKTYHGLASLKGSSEAATCTSCHEVHSILEQSSPRSSVNKANLKKTCGKCHDAVSDDFVNISVHPVNLKTRNIYGYYIRNAYVWLIILLISGMFIHNLIIFLYYIVQKHRKNKLQVNKIAVFPGVNILAFSLIKFNLYSVRI